MVVAQQRPPGCHPLESPAADSPTRQSILALKQREEVRSGEQGNRACTRSRARHNLESHERDVVIGDDGDEGELAKEQRGGSTGQEPCVSVEKRLGGRQELQLVGKRQQLLDLREGARSLKLGEDAGLLRSRQEAGFGEASRELELLNAREQAKRRLLRGRRGDGRSAPRSRVQPENTTAGSRIPDPVGASTHLHRGLTALEDALLIEAQHLRGPANRPGQSWPLCHCC
jgi:hypothetical protein